MATPAALAAARLGRASKVAKLASELREIALVGGTPTQLAAAAPGHAGLRYLPDDALDVMDHKQFEAGNILGARNEQTQSRLAKELRAATSSGGPIPDEYLQFLAHAGVDDETLDAVRSGSLPMDDASRARRALDIGLDPGRKWYRVDRPGKTEFLGRARNGLVYAGFTPVLAREASQAGTSQMYTLIGAANIDQLPRNRSERRLIDAAMRDRARIESHMSGQGSPAPSNLRPGTVRTEDGYEWHNPISQYVPGYGKAEGRRYVEGLRDQGIGGTLVRDEGGMSAALIGPMRHASLAVLNPAKAHMRNIFYAVPAAYTAASAAQQQQQGVLSGLKETR